MNITLWILQTMLAVAFLLHGWLYLSPPAAMVEQMDAVIPPAFRVFIGVAEGTGRGRTDVAGHHARHALVWCPVRLRG